MTRSPRVRCATAAGCPLARSAHRELIELFPEVAEAPEPYLRGYVHFDRHVELLLTGLDRAAGLASTETLGP